jgi:hypothetical protein
VTAARIALAVRVEGVVIAVYVYVRTMIRRTA